MALQFSNCIPFFLISMIICSCNGTDITNERLEMEKKRFSETYSLKNQEISMEKFPSQNFDSHINEVIKNDSQQIYYKFLNEIQGKIPAWRSPDGSSSIITPCESSVLNYIKASYLGLFTMESLFLGKKIPIYFPVDDKYIKTFNPFISKDQNPNFNKNPYSKICELKQNQDQASSQTRFCAKSLHSLLDYIRTVFESENGFKVAETTHYPPLTRALLQDYIITENPKEIKGSNKLLCHPMFKSFYCHYDDEAARIVKVLLSGENGDEVEAIGVCHMDTSGMSSNHIAFRLLPIKPGSPFCHFLPAGHHVWVQSPTIINLFSD